MSRQALTANLLSTGAAVFYTADGQWSAYWSEAAFYSAEEGDKLLHTIKASPYLKDVADLYLIDVDEEQDPPMPVRYRECLRVYGPSIRPDLQRPLSPAAE